MAQPSHDPCRLDVEAFAAEGAALEGTWPLSGMPRLLDGVDSRTADEGQVTWRAEGERTPPRGRAPRLWLYLGARTQVVMTCQRCLGPLEVALAVDRRFGFVEGEAEAAALDADSEDDVLAVERPFDLHALVEDELLLELPLVPRHADCSPPVGERGEDAAEATAHRPFAALEALRRKAH